MHIPNARGVTHKDRNELDSMWRSYSLVGLYGEKVEGKM